MDVETRSPGLMPDPGKLRELVRRSLHRCHQRLAETNNELANLSSTTHPVRRRAVTIGAEVEQRIAAESMAALAVLDRRLTGGFFPEPRRLSFPASRPESRTSGGGMTGYGAVFYDGTAATQYELGYSLVERIASSAFSRAIAEKQDTRALFNHDPDHLLGRVSSGTLRLRTDGRGLRYDVDLGKARIAQDVADFLSRGDLTGSSFSFVVTREKYEREGDSVVRWLEDVDLVDLGPVTFPAYTSTTASLGDRSAPRRGKVPVYSRDAVRVRARLVELGIA